MKKERSTLKRYCRIAAVFALICALLSSAAVPAFALDEPDGQMHEHVWDWEHGKVLNPDATCGEMRKTEYTCSICGETTVQEYEIWHEWDNGKVLNPGAICGEMRKTEYTCTVCGKKEIREETIEHDLGLPVIRKDPATCAENGVYTQTCKKCGQTVTTLFEGPHDYQLVEVEQEPTSEAPGYAHYICRRCGKDLSCSYGLGVNEIKIVPRGSLTENISGSKTGRREFTIVSGNDSGLGWIGSSGDGKTEYDRGYFHYDIEKADLDIELTLEDGSKVHSNTAALWKHCCELTFIDSQSANSPWALGEHRVTGVLVRSNSNEEMCRTDFTVQVLPSPIESMSAKFVTQIPDDYDSVDALISELSAKTGISYEDQTVVAAMHTLLTVEYDDGTVETTFASQKYREAFTFKRIREKDGVLTVDAECCGFPLSYTIPVVPHSELPAAQAELPTAALPLDWDSVALPEGIRSAKDVDALVSNGDHVVFLYTEKQEWNRIPWLAVLDADKTLHTEKVADILSRTVSVDRAPYGVSLYLAHGRFFLSVNLVNEAGEGAEQGWSDHIVLVSDDMKSFTPVKLPELGDDLRVYDYKPVEIYAVGERYLAAFTCCDAGASEYDEDGNGIDPYRAVALSADLENWGEVFTPKAYENGYYGWSELDVLGTTDRGVLLHAYSLEEGTAETIHEQTVYTQDFKTFIPVAPELSQAGDIFFLGNDNDSGTVLLLAVDRLGSYALSIKLLRFNETTGETVEAADLGGTAKTWRYIPGEYPEVAVQLTDGSFVFTADQNGEQLGKTRLPYKLSEVENSAMLWGTDDDGVTHYLSLQALNGNSEILVSQDAFRTILRLTGPQTDAQRMFTWLEDSVVVLADKIYICDGDTLDSYLTGKGAAEPGAKGSGDLNGDGRITSTDARLALRAAAKLEPLSEEAAAAADVNGDGKVTSTDARIVLRVAAKLETL